MNVDRRKARVLALQALYQLDVRGDSSCEEVEAFLEESEDPAGVVEYARELVRQTWARRGEFDDWIREASKHWDIARMTVVDRNILRMAALEMICREDPPEKVAIDEAIELGKEFGTNESPQFINGILDAIRKKHNPPSAC